MNPFHPPTLKALCARADLRPSKAAGQNFLIHGGTLEAIVDAVLCSGDPPPAQSEVEGWSPEGGDGAPPLRILEVGAGFGVLTRALAERGAQIIAIERDARIVPILREQVAEYKQVEVVEGDILALLRAAQGTEERRTEERRTKRTNTTENGRTGNPIHFPVLRSDVPPFSVPYGPSVLRSAWSLVANLPYSITSDFLRLLFDTVGTGALSPPERVVLLLQHEVVERLLGRTPADVGLLTMIARLHCTRIHRIAKVPPSHFWPTPKVASAVVVMEGWRSPEEIVDLLHCRRGGAPSLGSLPSRWEGRLGGVGAVECPPTPHPLLLPPPNGRGRIGRAATAGRPYAESCSSSFIVHRSSFLSLLTRAFSHPRRQLQNNLHLPPAAWTAAGVAPTARPATLTLEQWIALAREMV